MPVGWVCEDEVKSILGLFRKHFHRQKTAKIMLNYSDFRITLIPPKTLQAVLFYYI